MLFDLTDKLVWVAGQHGMVGGAMMRRLRGEPCSLLLDPGRAAVDFRRQSEVEDWMALHCPRVVLLTAGRVGGYDNLLIEANIVHAGTASVSKNFCSSARRASIPVRLPSRFPKTLC